MSRKTPNNIPGRKARGGGQKAAKAVKVVMQRVFHADNYGVEVAGLGELADMVLASELVLIMEHLKDELAADNYGQ